MHALDGRSTLGEAQRRRHGLRFGEGQGEGAVEDVASPQCVHRLDLEGGKVPHLARLEPEDPLGADGDGEPGFAAPSCGNEPFARVVETGHGRERLLAEGDVRCGVQQPFGAVVRHAVEIDDRRPAAPPGPGQRRGGALDPARVGHHRIHLEAEGVEVGAGAAEMAGFGVVDEETMAGAVDEDGGERRLAAIHPFHAAGIDALGLERGGDGLAGEILAEAGGDGRPAAKAGDGDGGVGGDPAHDLLPGSGIAFGVARGHRLDAEDDVVDGDAEGEDGGHEAIACR